MESGWVRFRGGSRDLGLRVSGFSDRMKQKI